MTPIRPYEDFYSPRPRSPPANAAEPSRPTREKARGEVPATHPPRDRSENRGFDTPKVYSGRTVIKASAVGVALWLLWQGLTCHLEVEATIDVDVRASQGVEHV